MLVYFLAWALLMSGIFCAQSKTISHCEGVHTGRLKITSISYRGYFDFSPYYQVKTLGGSATVSYPASFNRGSSKILLALNSFQYTSSNDVNVRRVQISTTTSTQFTVLFQITTSIQKSQFTVSYFVFDSNLISGLTLIQYKIGSGSNVISKDYYEETIKSYYISVLGDSIDTSSATKVIPFITHILYYMSPSSYYNFKIILSMATNSGNPILYITIGSYCYIGRLQYNALFVDDVNLQQYYDSFIDIGAISGSGGSLSSITILSPKRTADFMLGIISIYHGYQSMRIDVDDNGQLSIYTGSYNQLTLNYLNCRYQKCPTSYPYELSNGQCDTACPLYSFADSKKKCISCKYTCQTCSTDTTCDTCSQTNHHRTKSGDQCKCLDAYYDNALRECAACPSNCNLCTNNICSKCTQTLVSYSYYSNTYQTNYVPASDGTCGLCKQLIPNCRTCSSRTSCSQCVVVNFTKSGSSCVCNTAQQYFSDGSNCTHCSDLILGCLDCSSSSVCISCNAFLHFVPKNSRCQCQTGYFLSGKQCLKCHYSCQQCEVAATNCTKCTSSYYRTIDSNRCPCNTGYYDNGVQGLCQKCKITCLTCNDGATCSSCDGNNNLTLSNSQCICLTSEYALVTNYCKLCKQLIPNCADCSSYRTCKTCIYKYTPSLNNQSCLCNPLIQYFPYPTHANCQLCPNIINGCTNCQSNITCLTCISVNFTLATNQKSCPCNQVDQYFEDGLLCRKCGELKYMCIDCLSNQTCLKCAVKNFTVKSGSCECDTISNYHPWGILCYNCSDLVWGCTICASNLSCAMCFSPNFTDTLTLTHNCDCTYHDRVQQYLVWKKTCVLCRDIILGCLDCRDNLTCLECDQTLSVSGYFKLQPSTQRCLCIDGYYLLGVICDPCDPSCLTCVGSSTFCLTCNTTALRYFNNNACDCVYPFSDCRFSGIPECELHTCTYLSVVNITIEAMIKNPEANSLTLKILLDPITPDFDSFNFYELIDLGLPDDTQIVLSYKNGTITAEINYFENMQGNWTNITLNLNKTLPWYFQLAPQTIKNYEVAPTNNLASNIYQDQIYKQRSNLSTAISIIVGVGLLVYIIGLATAKIAVTEMVGVMQLSYFGLFIVNFSDPLIHSLQKLQFTNGMNTLTEIVQQKVPDRVYSVGFTSSTFSNLNYMLVLLMIPPIVSFIFYRIHLSSVKYRIRMQKYWKLVIGQWFLTSVLFTLYNYSSSLIAFCIFSDLFGWQFYASLVQLLVVSGTIGVSLWLFITKDEIWMGEYKNNFNWNVFSGRYYLIPIGQRLLVGILLTAANVSFASGIISVLVLIANLIIVAIKKPFVQMFQNVRSMITNTYGIMILSLYIALSVNGPSHGHSIFTYFPYIIVIIVILNIVTGLGFTVVWYIVGSKKKVHDIKCDIEDNQEQELQLQMNKKMQEMIKDAKNNNIYNKLVAGSRKPKTGIAPLPQLNVPAVQQKN